MAKTISVKEFALAVVILLLMVSFGLAIEQKNINEIDTEQLGRATQFTAESNNDFFNFIWWIPNEFWEATLVNEKAISALEREEMLATFRPYSIIAVVQADVTSFGAFLFYSKDEILPGLSISYELSDGSISNIDIARDIDPNLELLLAGMTPILSSAMGNMGNNMHFYVLEDLDESGQRILDPYKPGKMIVNLKDKKDNLFTADLEFPLDCLYIPRICPNGKEAHVSWKYCPWTGEELSD